MHPDVDSYTAQIVPNTLTTASGQYFDLNQPFAMPRYGNQCTGYITGREYMADVADAIRKAKSFILIGDWQLDFDVELDNRGKDGHPGRLSELLAEALKNGVHIRVLLYDSVQFKLDTHEEVSRRILEGLPKGKGSIKVMLQNASTGRAGVWGRNVPNVSSNIVFAHHQKFVVVDGSIAFLGGMDLAYGRWETPAFHIVIDPNIHIINDAYNQQIPPARRLTDDENKLTAANEGLPGFRQPFTVPPHEVLDPKTQPRQPWEDVGLKIEGPAAFDVFTNFVLRWNSFARSGSNAMDGTMNTAWFDRAKGKDYLVDPLAPGSGSNIVQICRSVSSYQLGIELELWDDNHKYVNDDWKQPNPKRRRVVQAARAAWAGNHQTSILDAMVNGIRSAQAFIYMENQFFMSACGPDENGTAPPSTNSIVEELANAVGRAIFANRPFHIYLVLPEHPEGRLEESATVSQAWWALQGVSRARLSLRNRINTFLYRKQASARKMRPAKNDDELRQFLALWGMADEWRKYLTVLNLRNYGRTTKGVLTEMIYVHSKFTIIDDAVAIIGTANINDRSLNGNGDTEIAAVVVDTAQAQMTDMGGGVRVVARGFARDLRKNVWRKHFGMSIDEPTEGSEKKDDPPEGIDIDRPLHPGTIDGIFKVARANRMAYDEVFSHTPRDSFRALTEGRKRYPKGDFSAMPPLRPNYMKGGGHDIAKAHAYLRAHVQGFFVEMPLLWGTNMSSPPSPGHIDMTIAQADGERQGPMQSQPEEASV
ncbi:MULTISPECIES: phospholipase D-like domain-containing protein [unclassified Achromobacter]|uniref:phospholipase D-like domain-containing protein n=1 Tax=unclassified Achromobacter TaxID=2626865 RepID=UPI000B5162B9|nr:MULTISPECIES: phospholipase D-like domain-containing protein [unclassified Achromobacter]OWT71500.1 hypothetical protein CEY05_25270 [Achromobacter sp. HZ34]OWT73157.1 hypothetical protein CEY04_24105 [Achromobacter sp. HZ28]